MFGVGEDAAIVAQLIAGNQAPRGNGSGS